MHTLKNRGFSDGYIVHRPFQRFDTQNFLSAISDGSYQVCAEVDESGKFFLCKHTIRKNDWLEIISPLEYYAGSNFSLSFPSKSMLDSYSNKEDYIKESLLKDNVYNTTTNTSNNVDFMKEEFCHLGEIKNDIGQIICIEDRFYLKLFKILTASGRELESIHSGNTNAIVLPTRLPAFSFLRVKI